MNQLRRLKSSAFTWSLNDTGFIAWQRPIVEAACIWAWNRWEDVCGIVPTRADVNGDIRIQAIEIGRRHPTVAWSEQPGFADWKPAPLRVNIDCHKTYCLDANPKKWVLDLGRILCHEFAHAVGIDCHLAPGNIMHDKYGDVRCPQAADIAEAVLRYGPPVSRRPGSPATETTGAPRERPLLSAGAGG